MITRLEYLKAGVVTLSLLSATLAAAAEKPGLAIPPYLPTPGSTVMIVLKAKPTKPNTTETTQYEGKVLGSCIEEMDIAASTVSKRFVYTHPLANKIPFGNRLMRNVGIGQEGLPEQPLNPPVKITIPGDAIQSIKLIKGSMSGQEAGCAFSRQVPGEFTVLRRKP